MLKRDVASSLRDTITLWILVYPPILALLARLLVPAVGGGTVTLVATPNLGETMVGRLGEYAAVEVVADRAALDGRVLRLDAAVGVIKEGGTYRLVLQGNESEQTRTLAGIVLADAVGPRAVAIRSVDLGQSASPVAGFVAVMFAMMSLVLAATLMSLNMVEDKETGNITSLAAAPLTRREYLVAKGALGLGVALLMVFASLYLMGAAPFNPWQVLAVTLSGFVSGALVGFYVGAVSDNQIAGIAYLKVGTLLFLMVPLITLVLPDRLEFILYPAPTYWTFLSFRGALIDAAAWPQILRWSGINLALSLVLVMLSARFLGRRLSLRG